MSIQERRKLCSRYLLEASDCIRDLAELRPLESIVIIILTQMTVLPFANKLICTIHEDRCLYDQHERVRHGMPNRQHQPNAHLTAKIKSLGPEIRRIEILRVRLHVLLNQSERKMTASIAKTNRSNVKFFRSYWERHTLCGRSASNPWSARIHSPIRREL